MIEMKLQLFGGRGSSSGGGGGGGNNSNEGGGGAPVSVPSKVMNVSYNEAEHLFNAPTGTSYTITDHQSGDYIGEYTKTSDGWSGSQKYKTNHSKPPKVTTANGFAMQVVGTDLRLNK